MKVLRWINKYLELSLMIVLLVVICCVMGAQVVMRYIVNHSLSWAEEFCGYAFVIFSCLSLSYTTKVNKHLRIDILLNVSSKRVKKCLNVINLICELFFSVMIIYGAPKYLSVAVKTNLLGSAFRIPLKYIYVWLAIGAAIMLFRTVQREVLRFLHRKEQPEEETKPKIKE